MGRRWTRALSVAIPRIRTMAELLLDLRKESKIKVQSKYVNCSDFLASTMHIIWPDVIHDGYEPFFMID
jgi:hypothetical protein